MRTALLSLLFALPTAALLAQGTEVVANGGFTATMTPWLQGGGSGINPGLSTGWDTTGLGASDSFGVHAGGPAGTPAPYPATWIEQTIVLAPGATYEFRADASGARPGSPTTASPDIGTVYAEVDGLEIARHAFGAYTPDQIERAQLCGRFTPATVGAVTLRIYFERSLPAAVTEPGINLDNVSVRDVVGPTYWIAGNRQPGGNVTHSVRGEPGALYGRFAALSLTPGGLTFPGVAGSLMLAPATTVTLGFGVLDGNGEDDEPATLPPLTTLHMPFQIMYQGGMAGSGTSLGLAFANAAF